MPIDLNRQRKTYSYTRVQPRYQEAQIIIDETLDWKNSVRAASTGTHALTGATPLTVGGVSLANEDRILLKNQSSASQNGIYYYVVSGGNYTLERASDVSQETISCGAATYVEEGTNGGKIYILSTPNPITVDSTSLTWTEFSSGGGGGNDYWVSTTDGALYSTGSVAIRGGLGSVDAAADIGTDVFLFVSGSITGSGADDKKSVFGGDVVMSGSLQVAGGRVAITGSLSATSGISGSLTNLTNGASYIVAGTGISVVSASNGQVTIASSGGSGPTGSGTDGYLARWTGTSTLGDSFIKDMTPNGLPTYGKYYKDYHQFVGNSDLGDWVVINSNNTTGGRVGIGTSPEVAFHIVEGLNGAVNTVVRLHNNNSSNNAGIGVNFRANGNTAMSGDSFKIEHSYESGNHITRFKMPNVAVQDYFTLGPVEELLRLSANRNVLVTGSLTARYDVSSGIKTVLEAQKFDGNQILWISSSAGSNPVGTDVFMWVSGSRTDNNSGADKVVFGGDVRVSGSLTIGTGSVFITSNDIQFGSTTMRVEKNGNDMKFFDITNPSGYTLTELAAGGGGGSSPEYWVSPSSGVIYATGSVGIGTSSISSRLHVSGSGTGTTTTLTARHGVANGSSLPVLNVQNSAGDSLLYVSGSGFVGIGTSTASAITDVLKSLGGNVVSISGPSASSLLFEVNGNLSGSISTSNSGMTVVPGANRTLSLGSDNSVKLSLDVEGDINLQTSDRYFDASISSGQGIRLRSSPGNSDAQVLDAYYEKDLVVTLESTNANLDCALYTSAQTLKFTRIGRVVTISGYLQVETVTATGTGRLYIDLGTTSGERPSSMSAVALYINQPDAAVDWNNPVVAYADSGTSRIYIDRYELGQGLSNGLTLSQFVVADQEFMVSVSYSTN